MNEVKQAYRQNVAVLLARRISCVPKAKIEEHQLRLDLGGPIDVRNPLEFNVVHLVRVCNINFGIIKGPGLDAT